MDKCAECGIYFQEEEAVKTCPVCGKNLHPECFEKFHEHAKDFKGVKTETGNEMKVENSVEEKIQHEFEGETIPFIPDHILSEITSMLLIIVVLSLMVIFIPTPLETVANPLETPDNVKPEWYFLFLFAFLHYVPTIVGIFVPLIGVVFLIFLPWIDRNPSTKMKDRKIALTITVILFIIIAILTYIGEFGGH